jgi:DNA-binding NarL/FixJ family response regulator
VGRSILIVDDNASVRHFLRSYLESQPGFDVCGEAVDGMDAIEKAGELHPDLIIMDFAMPRMNGLDSAMALRSILPDVPIILFTLHKSAVIKDRARNSGISAVLSKSEPIDALFEQIQLLLPPA